MRDDNSMQETIESVKQNGVLTPGIVRPRSEGGYEIVAGRRIKLACEAAGLEVMPVIIRDLDDEQSKQITQKSILPSMRMTSSSIRQQRRRLMSWA